MVKIRIDSTTPKIRQPSPTDEFAKRAEGMTHEQMVEAYRQTKPGDPWGDFLGWAISQQKVGETPAERDKRIGKGSSVEIPKGYSALSGFADVSNYGFMDEASAALDAVLGRRTYDQGLANARMQAAQAREANPKTYTAGQVAGGVPLAAQAALALPTSGGLGPMMLAGAGEGVVQGGLYGFGSGEGPQDRLWQAFEQALVGGALGAAAPLVGRGIGATYRAGKNAIVNSTAGKKATQSILKMIEDNNLSMDQIRSTLARMGNEGTLADVSPGMQVEAAGTAAASPAAAEKMSPRFAGRQDRAPVRIKSVLDEAMGPFQDPQAIADAVKATQKSTGPAYELAKQHVVDPEEAIGIIRREMQTYGPNSDTGQALAKFYSQLVDGKGNVIGQGHIVHGVRQELDAALRGGTVKNTGPFRAVRDKLDEVLKTQIPGFAEADKTWRGAQQVQEAFDYGQREVLGPNTYPGQFDKRWAAMSEPEKTAATSGTRAKIEMGQSGAPQPGLRLERTLEKNMNPAKVKPMVERVKPGGYAKLESALDAETTFRETNDLIQATRGSRTAPVALAAQNRWGMKPSAEGLSNALGNAATAGAVGGPQAALVSLAAQGAGAGAKGLFNWLKTANPKTIQMAGDMLSRQGAEASGVLQEVSKMLRANGATKAQADFIAQALTAGMIGQSALVSAESRGASPNARSRGQ